MSYDDEQLDQAYSILDIMTVANYFGIMNGEGKPVQPGLQKSPFRADKKGRSFSVYLNSRNGKYSGFKDHAYEEHKGGVWNFAKLCAPEKAGKDIRNLLVTLSGQEPKRLTTGQVKREQAVKRKELYAEQAEEVRDIPRLSGPEPGPWSVKIKERFQEGKNAMAAIADKTAATRGWTARVIVDLIAMGKTSSSLSELKLQPSANFW